MDGCFLKLHQWIRQPCVLLTCVLNWRKRILKVWFLLRWPSAVQWRDVTIHELTNTAMSPCLSPSDPSRHNVIMSLGCPQLKSHTLPMWVWWSDTVTWCMVEWCTQNLRRNGNISCGTSHATTTERYQYITSVDINNTRYKRIQSLIRNHMPMCAVSLIESRE